MNLNQLRVFYAVARERSFTEAAKRLCITQPAATIQVRELERATGVRLFDRVDKKVILTDAGEALYAYARRIFTLIEEADHVLENARDLRWGRLRVGASRTLGAYHLPPLLNAFKARYPGVVLGLEIGNSEQVLDAVREFACEVGVVGAAVHHEKLVAVRFVQEALVLIVPAGHAWAARPEVSLTNLAGQPLIIREPGSATRHAIEEALREAGLTMEGSMELGSNEAIKRAVEEGLGIALISPTAVQREVEAGCLRALPVAGRGPVMSYRIVYHRDRHLSRVLGAFLEMARTVTG